MNEAKQMQKMVTLTAVVAACWYIGKWKLYSQILCLSSTIAILMKIYHNELFFTES